METSKQLHEMCSMVEELASMNKNFEKQLANNENNYKEIQVKMANFKKQIDDQFGINLMEFEQIKIRQTELAQLYSTYLDCED